MNRSELLSRLDDTSEKWDVVIVGGGATGLGIAVDAASRGYRTVLLEQADFAEGTSSKSTKLIHGGVRYLRSGEVSLVRESLRERGHLLRNAPNLVKPLSFVVPAYRWYEQFLYGSGLTLYDLLAGELGIGATEHLSSPETLSRISNLREEGLYGSTFYWDGQFDDARLAIAMAKTAVSAGACVLNHVKVERLTKSGDKITGLVAKDQIGGGEYEIPGKVVINATGAFSDSIRRLDDSGAPAVIAPSQGIHIVLDQKFLGGETGVMIPKTDDGRVLFAIPWHNRMLLGTTDTGGVPVELNPKPLESEIDYLIDHAGRYLSDRPRHEDIKATFAGLRPLVKPSGDMGSTSKLSRSHSIFVSESGLLTVGGGKWTTYRQMAEDAVDRAADLADLEPAPCVTHRLRLSDEPAKSEGAALGEELPYTMGDAVAAVREEMAMTLTDVLSRRLRATFLDEAATLAAAPEVAAMMATELGRDDQWVSEQLALLKELAPS